MKMLIVEDDSSSILTFVTVAKSAKWDCTDYGYSTPVDNEEIHRFLEQMCAEKPDVVIIDIALTADESALIDDVSLEHSEIREDLFSGFKYCRALVAERWKVPVVFLTQIKGANVTRAAMKAGADLVLVKSLPAGELLKEVTDLVKARATHDPVFFWELRDELATGADMWERATLENALNRFFLRDSAARRFGLFTASLRGILSPLFQGKVEAEKKVMLSLVKGQVLLSLVDPRLRDHVKHTGNVFWMGYRLLHEIQEFRDPGGLPGHLPALYDASGDLSKREQLLFTWSLAALFHDYGYIDERQAQVKELLESLFLGGRIELGDVRSGAAWRENMQRLRDFVDGLVGRDHFLYSFIDTVMTSYGSEMDCKEEGGKKKTLVDHGFLSAHRLLSLVPFADLDQQKKNIVLHAALAIACHNYVDMLRKWKFDKKSEGSLLLGAFPVVSLLAFCDTVQTWDRELEVDPAITRTETYDTLLERLVLSDIAHVSGSEICRFLVRRDEGASTYDFALRLRYYVELADGAKKVCEDLSDGIHRWRDSERLKEVCKTMGITSLVHGRVVYELPMLGEPIDASF